MKEKARTMGEPSSAPATSWGNRLPFLCPSFSRHRKLEGGEISKEYATHQHAQHRTRHRFNDYPENQQHHDFASAR
jgi:hypothetical protein